MNNIVGVIALTFGIILLILGFNESHSVSSDFSRFFTGNPSDRAIWMLIGGIIAVVIGSFVAITSARKRR